jgi:hypothetical protein
VCAQYCRIMTGRVDEEPRRHDGVRVSRTRHTAPLLTSRRHRCPAPTLLWCGSLQRRHDAHHMWRATCAAQPACSGAEAARCRMPCTVVSVPVTSRCRCVTVAGTALSGPRETMLTLLHTW